ncbi:MAG: protein phosphatase CheZ [Gammaproteobacteria bacterium]|nr:protein phosphatase CheZ [Gammaproteobacteria bacterium]
MASESIVSDLMLERARMLVKEIENGNENAAIYMLDDMTKIREGKLFQEMGHLTRELHDAMKNFTLGEHIAELTEEEIPDAKERLNHVITMTEQAADKTLTAVEAGLPLSENIQKCAGELDDKWQSFQNRDLLVEEFRELVKELDGFFPVLSDDARALNKHMSAIMMAQDFQDLTGQIIRRVIALVQDVEENLVKMIRLSGGAVVDEKKPEKGKTDIKAEGTHVPGTNKSADIVESQDDVDDLLSSLGF